MASPEGKLFSKTGSTHRYELLNLYLNNTLYYYPAREDLLQLIRESDDYFLLFALETPTIRNNSIKTVSSGFESRLILGIVSK